MKLQHCTLCPKACGADRTRTAGWCGGGAEMRAARAALHFWEDPALAEKVVQEQSFSLAVRCVVASARIGRLVRSGSEGDFGFSAV